MKKSGKKDIYIPEYINRDRLISMKSSVTTRKDLRRSLQTLNDYTKRGAEQFLPNSNISVAQSITIKRLTRIRKSQITRRMHELEKTPVTIGGIKQARNYAQMGSQEWLSLLDMKEQLKSMKTLEKMTSHELTVYMEKLEKWTRVPDNEKWRENYLEMFTDVANTYGVPFDIQHAIREELKDVDINTFSDIVFYDKLFQDIVFRYKAITDLGTDKAYETGSTDVQNNFKTLLDNLKETLSSYRNG